MIPLPRTILSLLNYLSGVTVAQKKVTNMILPSENTAEEVTHLSENEIRTGRADI